MSHIAVIGAGQIGASWSAHFLARGHDVVVWDPAPDGEARVRAVVDAAWPALTSLGLASGASPSRLRFEANPADAARGATFVQESAPERLPLKHELYAHIESTLAPDVIIASSTSGLLASDLQAGMQHPERFVVGHPYNPPHLIPLVEVVGGNQTSEETIERAMEFYRAEGKRPIRVRRELRGHIANRLQAAVWRESIHLVLTGAVTTAELDEAMSQGPGLRWALLGPFLNLHASGGPDGITHTLEHLGEPIREWSSDLGEYPTGDDYIGQIAASVDEELVGINFEDVLAARDRALLALLESKRDVGLGS